MTVNFKNERMYPVFVATGHPTLVGIKRTADGRNHLCPRAVWDIQQEVWNEIPRTLNVVYDPNAQDLVLTPRQIGSAIIQGIIVMNKKSWFDFHSLALQNASLNRPSEVLDRTFTES